MTGGIGGIAGSASLQAWGCFTFQHNTNWKSNGWNQGGSWDGNVTFLIGSGDYVRPTSKSVLFIIKY